MSNEETTPKREHGMTKNVSNTSLIGELISSREGSPVPVDGAPNSTEAVEDIPGPPSSEDIPCPPSAQEIHEVLSGDSGKPPRAPTLLLPRPSPPSRNSSSGRHSRKQSLDDLSALTCDDAGGEAIDLAFRQNSVSWDKEVGARDPHIAMPVFGETIDTSKPNPPRSPTTDATPPPVRAKRNWGKLKQAVVKEENINVRTVNPLETEAEAAILRALDRTRSRNAVKAGNVLPHVSDEAAALFKKDSTPEQHNLSSRKNSGGDERSMMSGTTASANNAKKGHRRDATLDNKLFDLATQMTKLQAAEGDGGRERTFTADSANNRERVFSAEDPHGPTDYKGNSGDVLVQNAAALFRRPLAAKRQASLGTNDNSSVSTHQQLDNSSGGVEGRRGSLRTSYRSGGSHDKKMQEVIFEGGESDDSEIDVEIGVGIITTDADEGTSAGDDGKKKKRFGFKPTKMLKVEVKEDFETFRRFLQPRTGTMKSYLLFLAVCIIFPGILVATILFHSGNPGLGREGATTSWFILFLVRQVITGTLAQCTQVFLIDYLSLRLRLTVRVFGTIFTLLLVQSKGWPCLVFFWGIYNFAMNSGQNKFAAHWLYWQDLMGVFNEAGNPSGTITYSRMNYTINAIAVVLGFVVALKRLWWGLYLGKRTYRHYGEDVAKTIKSMLLVSQVAQWGKDIERHGKHALKKRGFSSSASREILSSYRLAEFEVDADEEQPDIVDLDDHPADRTGKVIDETQVNKLTGGVTQSQVMKMNELLGAWEEPEVVGEQEENVSIASILQFRQMLSYMDEDYPFSLCFGPADSRDACVESAQRLFSKLMLLTPDEVVLPFDTLAVLAKDKDGQINVEEMKTLIRLFRPDRNGDLTCLDFVKSCDEVYKQMRMLRASISNAGQVDHAFEIIVNIMFYLIAGIVILVVADLDPLALFVSVSGIILAFAFMIGSASAKYFEGILFILVRRPYDIGDRIALSNPDTPLSTDGSATWFVQTVGLFSTTVRFAATNEVATLANGSLASSRVINAKRSPQANVYVYMKFSVDVPYSKVMIFKRCVESFVKERPREWIALNGFRATRVEQDAGFIEYIVCLGHRNSWQDIGPILQSKADVASYCLELSKKLGLRYIAPPLPVNLSMADQSNLQQLLQPANKLADAFQEGAQSPTPSMTATPMSPDIRSISALFKKDP